MGKGEKKKGGGNEDEPFQFTLAGFRFHHDGTHATTSEGRTVYLLLPLGDRAPHAGIDDAFWMDGGWTLGKREAVGDAGVGRTEDGERQSGERFWASSARTDTGRNGRGAKGGHYCAG
jgi:hypothetical protein